MSPEHSNSDNEDYYKYGALTVLISPSSEFESDEQDPKLCTLNTTSLKDHELTLGYMHDSGLNNIDTLHSSNPWEFNDTLVAQNCHLEVPHWEYKKIGKRKFIEFEGALTNWARNATDKVNINIPLHSSLAIPMTTQFVRIPIDSTVDETKYSKALDELNKVLYTAKGEQLDYDETESINAANSCGLKQVFENLGQ